METFFLQDNLTTFYITAEHFPEGIKAAFQKLHSLVSFSSERNFFGISHPNEKKQIIYHAATSEMYEGEAQKYACETFILKKGNYASILINNYMQDISSIGKAFEKLLTHPQLDFEGCCVEMYLSDKDVRCMVKILDE